MRHTLSFALLAALMAVPAIVVAAPRYVFPQSVDLGVNPAQAPTVRDSSCIFYDDGIPYYYWTLSAGDRAAVRFTVPAPSAMDSAEVLAIQVMLYDATGPGNIRLHIWSDANGLPGVDLMPPMTVTPTYYASPGNHVWNSFVDVRFLDQPSPGYQQVEQDIWVGYELLSNAPNPLGDVATITHRSYFFEGGQWVPVDDSDLMIRIWWGQDVPVTLVSFTAQVVESGVLLRWDTASEKENFGFRVLRSTQVAGPFAPVSDIIPGAGTTDVPQHYEFLDSGVQWGKCYYYQLEDISLDGSTTRTPPLTVAYGAPPVPPLPDMMALRVAPNPFVDQARFTFQVGSQEGFLNSSSRPTARVNLSVYDIQGRLCRTLYFGHAFPGTYQVSWDGTTEEGVVVPPGVYVCRLEVDGRADAARVVRTR